MWMIGWWTIGHALERGKTTNEQKRRLACGSWKHNCEERSHFFRSRISFVIWSAFSRQFSYLNSSVEISLRIPSILNLWSCWFEIVDWISEFEMTAEMLTDCWKKSRRAAQEWRTLINRGVEHPTQESFNSTSTRIIPTQSNRVSSSH